MIKLVLFITCFIIGAKADYLRCITGTRIEFNGTTIYDNARVSICDKKATFCILYNYTQQFYEAGYGYIVNAQFGECGYDLDKVSCKNILEPLAFYGEVLSCDVETCDSSLCSTFTAPELLANCESKGDRIFPGCTAEQAFEGISKCIFPMIFGGFSNCQNTLEEAYVCLSKVVSTCLDSSCSSLFDFIPGLRSMYPEILHYSKIIRNTDDLHRVVSLYKGDTEFVRPIIKDFICPRNKAVAESFIAGMEANITQFDKLFESYYSIYPCPLVMQTLQNNSFTFLRAFYDAKGPEEVYSAYLDFVKNLRKLDDRCDLYGIVDAIPSLINLTGIAVPQKSLRSFMKDALDFSTTFPPEMNFTKPDLDSCPAEPTDTKYGLIKLSCERYYGLDTKCDQKKAWLCSFAEWRFNFLRTWLNHFYESFPDVDDTELPFSSDKSDEDSFVCKKSTLCCYDAPKGRRLCYCTEHDYDTSFTDVFKVWKKSYNNWIAIYHKYQSLLKNEDTC